MGINWGFKGLKNIEGNTFVFYCLRKGGVSCWNTRYVCAYIRKTCSSGVLVLNLDNKSKYLHMNWSS